MAMGFASAALVAAIVVISVIVGARSADTDCTRALSGVAGCASFLTNPSSTPDLKTCCQPLQSVLTTPTSFQCLCAQATNSQSAAFKNALRLPEACKLDINVSASNCTTTSTTPSTTPATTTPMVANSTTSGSGGFLSASPYSPFVAMAVLCSIASILL